MTPDTSVIWRDLGLVPSATLYAIADVHLGNVRKHAGGGYQQIAPVSIKAYRS